MRGSSFVDVPLGHKVKFEKGRNRPCVADACLLGTTRRCQPGSAAAVCPVGTSGTFERSEATWRSAAVKTSGG